MQRLSGCSRLTHFLSAGRASCWPPRRPTCAAAARPSRGSTGSTSTGSHFNTPSPPFIKPLHEPTSTTAAVLMEQSVTGCCRCRFTGHPDRRQQQHQTLNIYSKKRVLTWQNQSRHAVRSSGESMASLCQTASLQSGFLLSVCCASKQWRFFCCIGARCSRSAHGFSLRFVSAPRL